MNFFFLKSAFVFLIACGAVALFWQITIHLISRARESSRSQAVKEIKHEDEPAVIWSSARECGTLVSIRKSKSGKIFFYDLMGNRVSKIPRKKRNIALKHDCFLGQKRKGSIIRWEPVKRSEVEGFLNNQGFRERHSAPPLLSGGQTKDSQKRSLQSMKGDLESSGIKGLTPSAIQFMIEERGRDVWIACHQVRHDGSPKWVDFSGSDGTLEFWQSICENPQVCAGGIIDQGSGEFGLESSNPIPVFGPPGATAYLINLISVKSNEYVSFRRQGSVRSSNINNPIDRYFVWDSSGNQTDLFLSCYHQINSHQAPLGFKLNAQVFDKREGKPLVTRKL